MKVLATTNDEGQTVYLSVDGYWIPNINEAVLMEEEIYSTIDNSYYNTPMFYVEIEK